jgi:hypothetical protein
MSIWIKSNVIIEFVYPKIHIHSLQILLGGWFLVILYNNKCKNGVYEGFNHQQWKIWPQQIIFPRILFFSIISFLFLCTQTIILGGKSEQNWLLWFVICKIIVVEKLIYHNIKMTGWISNLSYIMILFWMNATNNNNRFN